MKLRNSIKYLAAATMAIPLAHGAVIATVDPDGAAPDGGTVGLTGGGRDVADSGATFNGSVYSTVYIGFSMDVTGGNFYHGFEAFNGVPLGGEPNRSIQIADENTGSVILRLNNGSIGTVHANGDYAHSYVIKVDFNQSGSNELVSVFLDPVAGTSEGANTAVLTGSADIQFSHAGFASFIGPEADVVYSNVTFAENWNDVVVPEPSAAALGALGFLFLLRRRR